jgi:uncharacterized protein YbaR (Trm112 family)
MGRRRGRRTAETGAIVQAFKENRPVPVDAELLQILACPSCKTPVTLVKNGTGLKCGQCHRVFPIKDDIPVMLLDEATVEAD